MIRRQIRVTGQVQGVGFRWFAKMTASRLGLTGWVRNCPDGSVELEVQGDEAAVEAMVEAVSRGPGYAWVDQVTTAPRPLADEYSFHVTG